MEMSVRQRGQPRKLNVMRAPDFGKYLFWKMEEGRRNGGGVCTTQVLGLEMECVVCHIS